MNESKNEWIKEWMNQRMNEWMNEWNLSFIKNIGGSKVYSMAISYPFSNKKL
jgi:hypothetical protein